ncbi:aspartate/glutamate racemase family protein [Marinovum sp.]|uniref:aspartate/glutamate racemase family protein n=1 Tax=Marinovum sp. TaxID=2024839 RepID=UPI003A94E587
MNPRPRIALIHATRIAMAPIEATATRLWPEAETISILEEGLSVDRAKTAELTGDLARRIIDLCRYAVAARADGVLYTCSAFGAAISRAGAEAPVPVMTPNEAMFDAALSQGSRVAMIYTFPPAAAGMELEFHEAARRQGREATLRSVFCDGALEAKQAGDVAAHDRLIADCAADIEYADAIMLAQFSMASAEEAVRRVTDISVLSSPGAAITEMRRRVESFGMSAKS